MYSHESHVRLTRIWLQKSPLFLQKSLMFLRKSPPCICWTLKRLWWLRDIHESHVRLTSILLHKSPIFLQKSPAWLNLHTLDVGVFQKRREAVLLICPRKLHTDISFTEKPHTHASCSVKIPSERAFQSHDCYAEELTQTNCARKEPYTYRLFYEYVYRKSPTNRRLFSKEPYTYESCCMKIATERALQQITVMHKRHTLVHTHTHSTRTENKYMSIWNLKSEI